MCLMLIIAEVVQGVALSGVTPQNVDPEQGSP